MRDKKKMMILVALIAVVGVSIGFAAFSSSLLIKSSLSVNPTGEDFKVVFSSSSTSLATNAITPSKTDSAIKVEQAQIDNTGNYPMIKNLKGTFTSSGQSITYTFYARNTGKYDAYLTSIVLQNLTNGSFTRCVAGTGTSQDLVNSACSAMKVSVTVGSETATSTTQITTEHKLAQNASEKVTVTLSYESNGALADGPFEVEFGNIFLTYGTQQQMEMPTLPEARDTICVATDSSESGSTALGTEYKCQLNESTYYNFYVLSTEGTDKVNLLMSENIDNNKYDFAKPECDDGTIVETADECYDMDYTDSFIAESQVVSLTSGWSNITTSARLPKYEEIAENVCTKRVEKIGGVYDEYGEPPVIDYYYGQCAEWAIGDYWTGAGDAWYAWAMNSTYETLDAYNLVYGGYLQYGIGIRPVITVNLSDLS